MAIALSVSHKQRFDEIKKRLSILGNKESSFIQVELLFYEALTISRTYGEDINSNGLLADLRQIQADQYEKTKELTRKSGRRESNIRRFISRFKTALAAKK